MGFKPKIRVSLVKCGNCGRSYNNPLNHICVQRASRSPQAKAAKKKPRGR
jgi:hypothetical protein